MKIRLIGAGAVGIPISYKLKDASDFALIVDKERKERYSKGLKYNGKKLQVTLLDGAEADIADLIIVAVKNFDLDEAILEIKPFVGENTAILPLLNGIEAEEKLSKEFGEEKVLYGFITSLSSNHEGLETMCFSDGGIIIFNEKDNIKSERIKKIEEVFKSSNQRYLVPSDIHHEKWWKFMLNTCYNTLSAILFADYVSIAETPEFTRLVRLVAKEVQTVALSEGVKLDQGDVERMIATLDNHRDHGQTSMLQDVRAHRRTENKYFSGAVSRLGKKNSVPTPYIDFIFTMLEAKRNIYGKS